MPTSALSLSCRRPKEEGQGLTLAVMLQETLRDILPEIDRAISATEELPVAAAAMLAAAAAAATTTTAVAVAVVGRPAGPHRMASRRQKVGITGAKPTLVAPVRAAAVTTTTTTTTATATVAAATNLVPRIPRKTAAAVTAVAVR